MNFIIILYTQDWACVCVCVCWYEDLDLSIKSLPGDKVLILSMCTPGGVQLFSEALTLKQTLFSCLRCSLRAVSDLAPV